MSTHSRIDRLLALLNAAKSVFEEMAEETDDPEVWLVEAADHLDEAVALLTKVLRS
jgi:hypothetical protein